MDKSHAGHHQENMMCSWKKYIFVSSFLTHFIIQAGRPKNKDYVQVLPIKQIRLLAWSLLQNTTFRSLYFLLFGEYKGVVSKKYNVFVKRTHALYFSVSDKFRLNQSCRNPIFEISQHNCWIFSRKFWQYAM